jgi:glycosyltransferase involved in cell wall biosynthesis
MNKIIRTSTVSVSLDKLLEGQLKYLNRFYNVLAVSGASKSLEVVKEREGVRVIPIKMQRNISLFEDLISLWKLYKIFKREKPLIIHSITPKAGLLSMLAGLFAGVPIRMHTFTGLIFPTRTGFMQKVLIAMDRLLCSCATHVYPEGQGVKKDLQDFNITKKPLKVLANGNINGINTSYFNSSLFQTKEIVNLRKNLGFNEQDVVFVFVGRMVGDKGINELIMAFKQLINNNQQLTVKLLLVGPFEEKLDRLQAATLIEIEDNPNIISVGSQQDVRPYFVLSNVLVFPSYREGFPNVVIQAGAMGLASIVTNINGCNEIIKEGKNGWIIPVKDEEAILNAMQNCLTNTKELNRLSKNSRNLIVNRYKQKVVWEAILNEYKTLENNV